MGGALEKLRPLVKKNGPVILVLFLGLYLGFTFLLAAVAVLALQQLSQGADNARRYALLGRLGVEEKALARSAAHQVTLAFLLPLGLGLIHAAVGLSAVNQVITVTGNLDSSSGSLSAMMGCNCLVELPAGTGPVGPGTEVEVLCFVQ